MPKNTNIAPLTFGVEFEFIIKSLPLQTGNPEDPEPNDLRPVKWNPALRSNPMYKDSSAHVYKELCKAFDMHGIPQADTRMSQIDPRDKWNIKGDASVEVAEEDENPLYDYTDVEIASPIFYVSNGKNMGLDEIRRALSVVRNEFRVHVPASAGFHCHVGNAKAGLTTFHMMNLQSILYVFNRQIQILHPNRQIDLITDKVAEKTVSHDIYYCSPARCNLGRYLSGEGGNRWEEARSFAKGAALAVPYPLAVDSSEPTEFSQAQRFINDETSDKIARNHLRIRKPGAIAQSLFKNDGIAVPVIELEQDEPIGSQLYTHLTQYLKQELDPEVKALLLTPGTKLDKSKQHYADPRLLLAPKILSKSSNLRELDRCSGTGQRQAAYNIHGLAESELRYSTGANKTIEFRQHQGTLDPDRAVAWIQMVTGMVEWTRTAPPVQITELLRIGGAVVDPADFDVVDLLRYMGLDEPAAYYEHEFFEPKV